MKLTLSGKISLILVGTLVVVTVVTAAIGQITMRRQLYSDLEGQNDRAVERLAYVVRDPLWFFDTDTLQRLAEFEISEDNLIGIRILGDNGDALVDLGETAELADIESAADEFVPIHGYSIETREVLRDDQMVGTVQLLTTDAAVVAQLSSALISTAAQLGFLAVAVGLAVGIGIRRTVVLPIRAIRSFVSSFAAFDLSERIDHRTSDETGVLAGNLNEFAEALTSMIRNIQGAAETNARAGELLATSLREISESTEGMNSLSLSLTDRSSTLKSRFAEVAKATEAASDTTRSLADATARQRDVVNRSASLTRDAMRDLSGIAGRLQSRLDLLSGISRRTEEGVSQMQGAKAAMSAITRSIQVVLDVVAVIDDVAEQSNVLAVNASIQAARVGKAGSAFAVVSNEMRNLSLVTAEHARRGAEHINALIAEAQEAAEVAGRAEEVVVAIFEDVRPIIDDVGRMLGEIHGVAYRSGEIESLLERATDTTNDVSNGASEIHGRTEEIITTMHDVNSIAGSDLETARELSESVHTISSQLESLSKMGEESARSTSVLNDAVKRFKT